MSELNNTQGADLSRAELEAYWMPYSANRQFKEDPRIIVEAKGSYFTDAKGRKVFDGLSGLWTCGAGHKDPKGIGLAIHNDTQETNGNIISVTETTVESNISWNTGDQYSIYKTTKKDTFLYSMGVDKSRGWKVSDKSKLDESGWFPEDHDIDKDAKGNRLPREDIPFGPGQPWRR